MLISSVGHTNTNTTVTSGFGLDPRIVISFSNLFWLKIDRTRNSNILGIIYAIVSRQCKTQSLIGKIVSSVCLSATA